MALHADSCAHDDRAIAWSGELLGALGGDGGGGDEQPLGPGRHRQRVPAQSLIFNKKSGRLVEVKPSSILANRALTWMIPSSA
ncbi:MAG: hypothetical protein M3319_14520 [Actinomycetota bacterium]|nr:hypothetical protein [Actinomycetota bacterium]